MLAFLTRRPWWTVAVVTFTVGPLCALLFGWAFGDVGFSCRCSNGQCLDSMTYGWEIPGNEAELCERACGGEGTFLGRAFCRSLDQRPKAAEPTATPPSSSGRLQRR